MSVRRLAAAVAMAAFLLVSLAPGAAGASWPGPTVISGWKNGPVTIPNSAGQTQMASMTLPKGKWLVWAKLFVSNATTGDASVSCALAGTGSQMGHEATAQVGSAVGAEAPSSQPFSLSAYLKFGQGGGDALLECGVFVDQGTPQLSARWIKFMAMRVGRITTVSMDSGHSKTAGSGKPVAILGVRPDWVSVPNGRNATLGKVWLAAGSWWVRASFSLQEDGPGYAYCQLKIGKKTLGDSVYVPSSEYGVMTVMDTATHVNKGQWAKVVCAGGSSLATYGPQRAGNLRIVAVRLGTLATLQDGVARTYGSGKPIAEYASTSAETTISYPGATVGPALVLAAAPWMVLAKQQASGHQVTCRLEAGFDYDRTELGTWSSFTLPLAVVHPFGANEMAALMCELSSGGAATITHGRLTAIRLGQLTNAPLN